MIRLYSTLSRSKEPLETVQPGKVGMYLCGPTVYKPSHIGHMVGPVIFDAIKRYLTYSGYDVTFVVNITDVDDKLINESNARGISMAALAEEMTADYMRNIQALGVDTIDHFPRCTDNIGEIIEFTKTLIAKGFAYQSEGDVYFDVTKDHDYGKLSNRSHGRNAGRRRQHGRAEAQRGRLRLVEDGQAGRALVAQPLGSGPAGLAHRVLGHEPPPAGHRPSTSTAAGWTSSSRTTRTKWPKASVPTASRWPSTGCTTACSRPRMKSARWAAGRRDRRPGILTPRSPTRSANRRVRRRSGNCSSNSAPRRSASSSWPRTIAGRSSIARPASARRKRRWRTSTASSSVTNG